MVGFLSAEATDILWNRSDDFYCASEDPAPDQLLNNNRF